MNKLLTPLLLVCALCPVAYTTPSQAAGPWWNWPRYTLRFEEGGTLKDVFDSGLRPFRFPSLESSVLEFKHARITVVQLDGTVLPEFPVDYMEFKPRSTGLLSSIAMTSFNLSLEQAREAMYHWMPRGERTVQELEAYLAGIRADPLRHHQPYAAENDFPVGWTDAAGLRCGVWLSPSYYPRLPLKLNLSLSWSRVWKPKDLRRPYKVPIPPPPGYEHVSMDATGDFGPDSPDEARITRGEPPLHDRPASTPSSQATVDQPSTPHRTRNNPEPSPTVGATAHPATGATVASRRRGAWFLLAALLALVAALAMFRRARRAR